MSLDPLGLPKITDKTEISLNIRPYGKHMMPSSVCLVDQDTFRKLVLPLWHRMRKIICTKDQSNISNVAICRSKGRRP